MDRPYSTQEDAPHHEGTPPFALEDGQRGHEMQDDVQVNLEISEMQDDEEGARKHLRKSFEYQEEPSNKKSTPTSSSEGIENQCQNFALNLNTVVDVEFRMYPGDGPMHQEANIESQYGHSHDPPYDLDHNRSSTDSPSSHDARCSSPVEEHSIDEDPDLVLDDYDHCSNDLYSRQTHNYGIPGDTDVANTSNFGYNGSSGRSNSNFVDSFVSESGQKTYYNPSDHKHPSTHQVKTDPYNGSHSPRTFSSPNAMNDGNGDSFGQFNSFLVKESDLGLHSHVWIVSQKWWNDLLSDNYAEISNLDLCDESGKIIRTLFSTEYKLVSKEGWEQLHAMFGGGPELKRPVIQEEVHSIKYTVDYRIHKMTVKLQGSSEQGSVEIFRRTTAGELLEMVAEKFGIDPTLHAIKVTSATGVVYNQCETNDVRIFRASVIETDIIVIYEITKGYLQDIQQRSFSIYPASITQPGLVGLQNLGNTCYMNSILQCLSHITEFREFFLHGTFESNINHCNPLGTQGKLVAAYADLVKNMWVDPCSFIEPSNLRKIFVAFAPLFEDFEQHDAHEFLSSLLDGLHEDLNRVHDKPTTDKIEKGDMTDEQAALLSWETHLKRNDSFIVDKFFGQLKSRITCPTCSRVSVTFDAFSSITVPVGGNINYNLKLTFNRLSGQRVEYGLSLPKSSTTRDIFRAFADLALVNENRLLLAEVRYNAVERIFDISGVLSELIDKDDCIVIFELAEDINYDDPYLMIVSLQHASNVKNRYSDFSLIGPHLFTAFSKPSFNYQALITRVQEISPEFTGVADAIHDETPSLLALPESMHWCPDDQLFRLYRSSSSHPYNQDSATPITGDEDLVGNISIIFCCWNSRISRSVSNQTKAFSKIKHSSATELPGTPVVTLERTLQLFSEEEELSEENMWYCSNCKQLQQAFKKIDIWKLPDNLIIHFKRFYYSAAFREKLETVVRLPLSTIDLSEFVHDPSCQSERFLYKLTSIVCHTGGLNYGHYTSRILVKDLKWYKFDDRYVDPVYYMDYESADPYIVFLERVKDIPTSEASPAFAKTAPSQNSYPASMNPFT